MTELKGRGEDETLEMKMNCTEKHTRTRGGSINNDFITSAGIGNSDGVVGGGQRPLLPLFSQKIPSSSHFVQFLIKKVSDKEL